MSTTSLIQRVHELLDRPHGFLIYNGGEGGEYMTRRISQYSTRHGTNIPATTDDYDVSINRTRLQYPGIYELFTLPNETYFMTSRDEVIPALTSRGLLTESMVTAAEEWSNSCALPLIRIHQLNNILFSNPESWYFSLPQLYQEYTHALMGIKIRIEAENIVKWWDWYVETWVRQWSDNQVPFWSKEEVSEYVLSLGVSSVNALAVKLLIRGLGPRPASMESVFQSSVGELHNEYREWLYPDFKYYISQLSRRFLAAPAPRHLLDYRRSIEDPQYLASRFDIEDYQGFHAGVKEWHTKNLDLLLANGYSDFENLRLS